MDNDTFIKLMADGMQRDAKQVQALVEGLRTVINDCAASLDTVAIPGFGNFVPVNNPETITTDLSTGKRMLLPPRVTLEFTAAAMLKKRIYHE